MKMISMGILLLSTSMAFAQPEESQSIKECTSENGKITISTEEGLSDLTLVSVKGEIKTTSKTVIINETMEFLTGPMTDEQGNDLALYNGSSFHTLLTDSEDGKISTATIYSGYDYETEALSGKIATLKCGDFITR